MSNFENYTQTSESYDKTRVPFGVEVILGWFAQGSTPLDQLVVLDAGCGTGNYSQALLDYVGRIEAVDLNTEMLAMASAKLATARETGRVTFNRAAIDALPFEDATFDGIMVNQVLHHLPDSDAAGYPAYHRVLREFSRVLRAGGALVINICSHEQLARGFWPYTLIPEATENMRKRHIPIDDLATVLEDCAFSYRGRFVPLDAVIQGEAYFDPRGPLSKQWRDGDSIWAMATETELEQALARVRQLDALDELNDFVARYDAHRKNVGQVTFVFATRR
ncbi:MAG: class I SAM-dependent methyltransferase [Acidiferrobacterales bacterium]